MVKRREVAAALGAMAHEALVRCRALGVVLVDLADGGELGLLDLGKTVQRIALLGGMLHLIHKCSSGV